MISKSKVKYIQSLHQKKFRDQEGVFFVEGEKMIAELVADFYKEIIEIYALEEWVLTNKIAAQVPVTVIDERVLQQLSQLKTPNKVLALVRQRKKGVAAAPQKEVVLALDRIQDPGNMGTIIRIADWFGISQLICSPDTTDCYNSKVVQATMGSIMRVNIHYTVLEDWINAHPGVRVYGALLNGKDIRTMERLSQGVILIGNESKGISTPLQQLINVRIAIKGNGNAESLNAAVATGIILSHLT